MGFSCKVIIFYAFMLHTFHHISSKEEKIEDMGDISDIKVIDCAKNQDNVENIIEISCVPNTRGSGNGRKIVKQFLIYIKKKSIASLIV